MVTHNPTCIQDTEAVGHWALREFGWFSFGPQSTLSASVSERTIWSCQSQCSELLPSHWRRSAWADKDDLHSWSFQVTRCKMWIYNTDLVGSVFIPITGLPLLRILLEPIRNVPSPPVVTTMSAHLNVSLRRKFSTNSSIIEQNKNIVEESTTGFER